MADIWFELGKKKMRVFFLLHNEFLEETYIAMKSENQSKPLVSQTYIAQEYYWWDKASIKYAIYIKLKDRW